MNELLFNVCLSAAKDIVSRYRATVPEGMEFYNGGGGSSSTDNTFSRQGTSTQTRNPNIPSFLQGLVTTTAKQSAVPDSLVNSSNTFLGNLLTKDANSVPNEKWINTAVSDLDPTNFEGRTPLVNMANTDVTGTAYEAATDAKYEDLVQQALSQVTSGPDVVRGGTARSSLLQGEAANRMALERADNLRQARLQDAAMSQRAVELLNNIEQGRRMALLQGQQQMGQQVLAQTGQQLQGEQQATQKQEAGGNLQAVIGKLIAGESQTVKEDMQGEGSGQTTGFNVGANCCFIFMAGLDNELPWFVRRARDLFYDECPGRGVGYIRMSKWLVPAMKNCKGLKWVVNTLLITPCMKYGAWLFADESAKPRWRFYAPYVKAWFAFWNLYGKM